MLITCPYWQHNTNTMHWEELDFIKMVQLTHMAQVQTVYLILFVQKHPYTIWISPFRGQRPLNILRSGCERVNWNSYNKWNYTSELIKKNLGCLSLPPPPPLLFLDQLSVVRHGTLYVVGSFFHSICGEAKQTSASIKQIFFVLVIFVFFMCRNCHSRVPVLIVSFSSLYCLTLCPRPFFWSWSDLSVN